MTRCMMIPGRSPPLHMSLAHEILTWSSLELNGPLDYFVIRAKSQEIVKLSFKSTKGFGLGIYCMVLYAKLSSYVDEAHAIYD